MHALKSAIIDLENATGVRHNSLRRVMNDSIQQQQLTGGNDDDEDLPPTPERRPRQTSHVTNKFYKGLYTGEWDFGANVPHGKGKWISYNPRDPQSFMQYEGSFKYGKFDGAGLLSTKKMNKLSAYQGFWKDDKKHGAGIHTFKYEGHGAYAFAGNWKNDKKDGDFTIVWPNLDTWKGKFKNNLPAVRTGEATFELSAEAVSRFGKSPSILEGYANASSSSSMQGGEKRKIDSEADTPRKKPKGSIAEVVNRSYMDGKYSGQWHLEMKVPHGKGTLRNEHWSYTGDWKDGKKDGEGTWEWRNKDVWKGKWSEDVPYGTGKATIKHFPTTSAIVALNYKKFKGIADLIENKNRAN